MSAEALTIAKDTVPQITYELTNDAGEVLDRSGAQPMAYLHGHGQLIEGLESALDGKAAGDHLDVTIAAADAYGDKTGKTVRVKKKEFGEKVPGKGQAFAAPDGQGGQMTLWVVDDRGAWLTVTPDHPLAGQTLHFSVDVVAVRAATESELEHGHAHGVGGHHHH